MPLSRSTLEDAGKHRGPLASGLLVGSRPSSDGVAIGFVLAGDSVVNGKEGRGLPGGDGDAVSWSWGAGLISVDSGASGVVESEGKGFSPGDGVSVVCDCGKVVLYGDGNRVDFKGGDALTVGRDEISGID